MRKRLILAALVAVFAGAAFIGWRVVQQTFSTPESNVAALTPARVALGQKLYAANCASCHGDKLQGQPNWKEQMPDGLLPAPPHDATGHTWHHPDQQLFQIIKLGTAAIVPNYKSNMAGFGDRLSDQEIWSIIGYIKSAWPSDIQDRQRTMTENAAAQGLGPSGAQ
jgi:mono/diheme cytochrome c family protein